MRMASHVGPMSRIYLNVTGKSMLNGPTNFTTIIFFFNNSIVTTIENERFGL